MDWLDDLDQRIVSESEMERKTSVARGLVEISLNLLVRFSLGTDAEMRMYPEQWDAGHYQGEKSWEVREDIDFGELGEVLLVDRSHKGAGLFSEFTLSKGRNVVRSGFIVPERVGENEINWYFVAYESPIEKADLADLWRAIRPGIEAWYESLIRADITPLAEHCERTLDRRQCPSLPGRT